MRSFARTFGLRLASLAGLLAVLGLIWLLWIRPGQLRWGATDEEVRRSMPDDSLVADPHLDATRAITIHARPEKIWPWLAQMGYRRAGFYGYDLIENLGSPRGLASADTILPEFQHPKPGDVLPISAVASVIYGAVAPPRYLVWRDAANPPHGVFMWELVPIDATQTRLVSRIRLRYHKPGFPLLLDLFTEFGDSVAVRKVLLGVRDRAEGRAPEPLRLQAVTRAAWLLAMLEFGVAAVTVVFLRSWELAWFAAFGAGLILLFVLYGPAPVWLNSVLPWVYLGLVEWVRWRRARFLRAARMSFAR